LSGGSSIIPGTETRSRPWAAVFFGVAFLVALSRIYLGKHYPSQVMAGAGIGVLWGFAAAASRERSSVWLETAMAEKRRFLTALDRDSPLHSLENETEPPKNRPAARARRERKIHF